MTVLLRIIVAATVALGFGVMGVSVYAARSQVQEDAPALPAGPATSVSGEALSVSLEPSPPVQVEASPVPTIAPGPARIVYPVPAEALPATRARPFAHQALPKPLATPVAGASRRHVIVLDPGHGRGDPGAVHHGADGAVDLTEATVNYSVAVLLQGFLEEKGYDVYLSRDGWGQAPPFLNQAIIWADLFSRVRLAHAVDADLYISIHANGSPRPEHQGVEMWYCGNHPYAEENAYLARLMLDAALEGLREYGYAAVNRDVQEDVEAHHPEDFQCRFLVTREARMPAILTELLFLTNDSDAAVLADERAREAMARSMAEAIDAFFQGRDDLSPQP